MSKQDDETIIYLPWINTAMKMYAVIHPIKMSNNNKHTHTHTHTSLPLSIPFLHLRVLLFLQASTCQLKAVFG
jgi:hypothetical protein